MAIDDNNKNILENFQKKYTTEEKKTMLEVSSGSSQSKNSLISRPRFQSFCPKYYNPQFFHSKYTSSNLFDSDIALPSSLNFGSIIPNLVISTCSIISISSFVSFYTKTSIFFCFSMSASICLSAYAFFCSNTSILFYVRPYFLASSPSYFYFSSFFFAALLDLIMSITKILMSIVILLLFFFLSCVFLDLAHHH